MLDTVKHSLNQPKIREVWQLLANTHQQNVNDRERVVSLAGGGILAAAGLLRRGWPGFGALCAGGYLLYRGLTGHCPAYETTGFSTAGQSDKLPEPVIKEPQEPPSARSTIQRGDIVDETAWETFPASDPPAWTTGRA